MHVVTCMYAQVVWGAIKSVEDRGYLVHLGVNAVSGFLANKATKGKPGEGLKVWNSARVTSQAKNIALARWASSMSH